MVCFINRISNIKYTSYLQIPPEVLNFIENLEYKDLIKPFVHDDIEKGCSRNFLTIKYRITHGEAITFERKYKKDKIDLL